MPTIINNLKHITPVKVKPYLYLNWAVTDVTQRCLYCCSRCHYCHFLSLSLLHCIVGYLCHAHCPVLPYCNIALDKVCTSCTIGFVVRFQTSLKNLTYCFCTLKSMLVWNFKHSHTLWLSNKTIFKSVKLFFNQYFVSNWVFFKNIVGV